MKLLYFIYFWVFYHNEILVSGLSLAYTILFKATKTEKGEILYHPSLTEPRQIVLLFNLVSMTPGTLSIDVRDDNAMLIHLVDMGQRDKAVKSIKKIENYIAKMI
ncbi:MAG: Na+/H+ antiporter subunit E [Breznakibacter sp.]